MHDIVNYAQEDWDEGLYVADTMTPIKGAPSAVLTLRPRDDGVKLDGKLVESEGIFAQL